MALGDLHNAERLHISFFGLRNAGKSSLVNAVTGQDLSVVSDIAGTTTDPVKKAMEMLPLGPVLIIDTPGFDDVGILGEKRIEKVEEILRQTDIAIYVVDAALGVSEKDNELLKLIEEKGIPYLIVFNKCDLLSNENKNISNDSIFVSAKENLNIDKLKNKISEIAKNHENKKYIIGDLLDEGDFVVLVTPIDESAPKGRIILPQQQVLREILDFKCSAIVCQETELESCLSNLNRNPKIVITDSQVFDQVDKIVQENIPLTSFSILFAKYKGDLDIFVDGVKALEQLKDGDDVLIAEACTHHRQCNDIGTVKLPKLIKTKLNVDPSFTFCSGNDFPKNLDNFKLIIHCGGCMINEAEMKSRIKLAQKAGVPIINYGILFAKLNDILDRSLAIFK